MNILLVEDNPDHVFLIERAIRDEMGMDAHLFHAASGEVAIEMLTCAAAGSSVGASAGNHGGALAGDHPRPDLILVDIQLPGRDGFWVVDTIKSHPDLQLIPIVMFTSSDSPADVERAYRCGVNSYVCKPTGPDEFSQAVRAIPAYWNRIAQLPRRVSS